MAGDPSSRTGQTLILLAILCGVAGWNYHRNAAIENARPRPYRSYSDEQLHQLISAYKDEVDAQMEHYRKTQDKSPVEVQGGGLIGDQIDEFERVQQLGQKRQQRAYKVTDNQILVEQLAKEELARERDRPIYKMIFRRLTTF